MSKRWQKGVQKLTFESRKRHFWVPYWRGRPLAKASARPTFSSHYEGRGPSVFVTKIALGTHCAPELLFFILLAPLLALKWDPRAPQASPKEPKGTPQPPQGHLNGIKKIDLGPTWAARGGRQAPGVPSGRQITQKRLKNFLFQCP